MKSMLFEFLAASILAISGAQTNINQILLEQGFLEARYWSDTKISYVGQIKQGSRNYAIYLYNGTNPESLHGINRLIVILNDDIYLGSYESLSAHDCIIQRQTVLCKADYPGYRIRFTKNGPPRQIWLDGSITEMSFAPRFRKRAGQE